MAAELRGLTWNLYHGRDFPPDPSLRTTRSRLLRRDERGATHVQVNRPLRREFASVLGTLEWDVALLQETPPHWVGELCRELGAAGAFARTARYFMHGVRACLSEWNPDLMASGGGGSNALLVRPPWRIADVRRFTFTRRPERRRLIWARLEGPGGARAAVSNMHASTQRRRATADVLASLARVEQWSGGLPLVFGGDLNLRPAENEGLFDSLHGLGPPTAADAIDHLLARGMELVEAPRRLAPEAREVVCADGRRLRLSDHPCVVARWLVR